MRCLIVRLSALGDIVHTWPLAELLRARCRNLHLTWVVESGFRALVDGHPAIDEVLEVRTRAWRRRPWQRQARQELASFRTALQEVAADVAIDPQGLIKSALVTRWSGAPRRIGLARPWRRELLAGFAYTQVVPGAHGSTHVVATNVLMAQPLGISPPESTPAPDGRWLLAEEAGNDGSGRDARRSGHATILPGAGGLSKILPVATLSTVAANLAAHGVPVVVAWGPGEESRARSIAAAAGPGVEVAPPTDLKELATLLGSSTVVIGGDTGPVHLAASLGVPTIGCFLATDWRRNGPLGPSVTVISAASTSSSPSPRARSQPVREITADEVLEAALRALC